MESIDVIYFDNIFPMKYEANSSRQEFIEDDISVVVIEQLINLYLKEILIKEDNNEALRNSKI